MSKKEQKGLVPKLRFPEFLNYEKWAVNPLNKVFKRITTKNTQNNKNVLTISAQQGLVSQLDYFNKVISARDLTGYYLLHKGDFAYNKSYSKGYPMGAIKRLNMYDNGVVSTLYICFRAKENYDSSFFEHYFESGAINSEIQKIAQEGGRAHGLLNVSINEFFKDIKVCTPTFKEQQKIADCLTSLDNLIVNQTKKLEALQDHKKGLMQQLFPAEGESIPKLRFPEFSNSNEWGGKTFGKLFKINSGKGFKAIEYTKKGVRLLQIENVGYGVIKWTQNTVYLPQEYLIEYPELILRCGDIVLALNRPVTNDELKIARIKKGDAPSILYQRVGKLEIINEKIGYDFAFHICCQFIKNFVIKRSVGSDQPFISLKDLYSQKISTPLSTYEQQKIADCLSSLDDLISAKAQKIELLKEHKKGLMQQLFPDMNEVGNE